MAQRGRWIFDVDWMSIGHFWTLAIEEQFYLVWPMIVLAFSRRSLMRMCVLYMFAALAIRYVLYLYGWRPISIGLFTLSRFDALALGAFAALAVRSDLSELFHRARHVAVAAAVAIVSVTFLRGDWDAADPVVQTVGFTLLAVFFAAMLILVVDPRPANATARIFSHPFLVWFGTYSYAMYVFHVALMPFFNRVFAVTTLSAYLGSTYLAVAAYAALSIATTAVVSYLSWHLYEKHFVALKAHFPSFAPAPALALRGDDPVQMLNPVSRLTSPVAPRR
jgi:peptidoglycan/LPS O-acetylase OafA/YrhL